MSDSPDQPDRDEIELEAVLHALSDPQRLRIVRELASDPEPRACRSFGLEVTKSTCTHHFRVLREAGLITQEIAGDLADELAAPRRHRRPLPGPARRRADRPPPGREPRGLSPRVASASSASESADRGGQRGDPGSASGSVQRPIPTSPEHEIAEIRSAWRSAGSATE